MLGDAALRALRTVHVLAAVLFLGNVIVTGVWSALFFRRRAEVDFRHAARAIVVTDWVFTVGGAILLVATGVTVAVGRGYPIMGTRWIRDAVIGLAISTCIWVVVLLPVQRALVRGTPRDDATLTRLYNRWNVAGAIAVVPLLYSLWCMTYKPT